MQERRKGSSMPTASEKATTNIYNKARCINRYLVRMTNICSNHKAINERMIPEVK